MELVQLDEEARSVIALRRSRTLAHGISAGGSTVGNGELGVEQARLGHLCHEAPVLRVPQAQRGVVAASVGGHGGGACAREPQLHHAVVDLLLVELLQMPLAHLSSWPFLRWYYHEFL